MSQSTSLLPFSLSASSSPRFQRLVTSPRASRRSQLSSDIGLKAERGAERERRRVEGKPFFSFLVLTFDLFHRNNDRRTARRRGPRDRRGGPPDRAGQVCQRQGHALPPGRGPLDERQRSRKRREGRQGGRDRFSISPAPERRGASRAPRRFLFLFCSCF